MLNAIIGSLVTVAFLLCLYGAYTLGRKQKRTDVAIKLSEQEQLEIEKKLKGFENIMNYDYDVAIGKRVST